MIAMSSNGTSLAPNTVKAEDLDSGLGHGISGRHTYLHVSETRKQLKMNVSLRRKIHIMALPQGTWNACLSAPRSPVRTLLLRPE